MDEVLKKWVQELLQQYPTLNKQEFLDVIASVQRIYVSDSRAFMELNESIKQRLHEIGCSVWTENLRKTHFVNCSRHCL